MVDEEIEIVSVLKGRQKLSSNVAENDVKVGKVLIYYSKSSEPDSPSTAEAGTSASNDTEIGSAPGKSENADIVDTKQNSSAKRRLGLPPCYTSASIAKRRREQEKAQKEKERLRKKYEKEQELQQKRQKRLQEEEERRARKKKEEEDRLERRRIEEEERLRKKEQKRLEEEERARKRQLEEEERRAKRLALEEEKRAKEEDRIAKKEAKENERIAKEKERLEKQQAKEEEARLKREEEELRKKEKEAEEDLKKKQSQQFIKFFKKNENGISSADAASDMAIDKDAASAVSSERFLSFQPKEGMHLAPFGRRSVLPNEEKARLDSLLGLDCDSEGNSSSALSHEVPRDNLYISLLCNGGHKPHRTANNRHWRCRPDSREEEPCAADESIKEIDVVFDGRVLPSSNGRTSSQSSTGTNPTAETGYMRVKFIGFEENYRPPYYGTWRKKTKPGECSGRNPFGRTTLLNYEVDSEDEWEEEPDDGDECGSDEEDLGDEGQEDEDPEEQDGFFVEHGYLSDDEGVESDGQEEEMRDMAARQVNGMAGEEDAESHRERMRMEAKVWKDKMNKKRRVEPLKLFAIPPTYAELIPADQLANDPFLNFLNKFQVIKCGN